MVPKRALILCLLLVIGALCVDAQRDGRRRSGRRKPTTESPPAIEEPENEKNPQKLDTEPEAIAKSSSAQPTETETNVPPAADKEAANGKDGGPPFIVPRGTRKPRPQVRNSGEARPRPTLPSFARKRGPKPERREFKQSDENSVVAPSSTSTTPKPSRGSSRNRGNNSQDRNSNNEKATQPNDETPTEATAAKKRFGGGPTRRPSRGNRRYNPTSES